MADQRQQAAASCQGQLLGGGAGPSTGWEECIHLPHGWIGSRSTGWEERRGNPSGWRARNSERGVGAGPTTWMARQTYFAAAGDSQKTTRSYAETEACLHDSLKQIKTKIQLMMKGTNIKINSPAMWFSNTMMEMKRNKTAEEPKKQNVSAIKRVALEEEDRVKMDRWMTEPVHKVRTMFPKQHHLCIHHVIHLQCHRFT